MFDYSVLGGGIVGLATAMTLCRRHAGARIVLFEKEFSLASHQTGRNSGVIHAGIYYKPGSYKARFAWEGCRSMIEFCRKWLSQIRPYYALLSETTEMLRDRAQFQFDYWAAPYGARPLLSSVPCWNRELLSGRARSSAAVTHPVKKPANKGQRPTQKQSHNAPQLVRHNF